MTNDNTTQENNKTIDNDPSHETESIQMIPSSLLTCKTIHNHESCRLMKVIFDSGCSHTMISSKCLPIYISPTLLQRGFTSFQTLAGVLNSNRFVSLNKIMLPEFDKAKKIDAHHALVFDSPCQYDMIIGRGFLQKIGFKA